MQRTVLTDKTSDKIKHILMSTCYELLNGQPSCSHGTIPTRGDNITQSPAPEDGHMVALNMLSNL